MRNVLTSAILWLAVFAIAGASLIVAGVFLLAGAGVALIVSGLFVLSFAAFIKKGLING